MMMRVDEDCNAVVGRGEKYLYFCKCYRNGKIICGNLQ